VFAVCAPRSALVLEGASNRGSSRRSPPAERLHAGGFKMNSGDTSYIWQLGNQTNINTDRGSGIASTQFCKVSVIGSKTGVVSQLNTEDSNAGGGLGGALGMYGSICANRLGMERQSMLAKQADPNTLPA